MNISWTLDLKFMIISKTCVTGRMVGCYKGKCCGSIRSIAKHPQLPLIASCGKLIGLRFLILFNCPSWDNLVPLRI